MEWVYVPENKINKENEDLINIAAIFNRKSRHKKYMK